MSRHPIFVILLAFDLVWAIFMLGRSIRGGTSRFIARWLGGQLLLFLAAAMAAPFYWMIMTSMKTSLEAARYPPAFFPAGELVAIFHQTVQNYRDAWFSPPGGLTFGRYFWVSFISAAASTAGVLATSSLAAFALARLRFPGRRTAFVAILGLLMVPPQVLMIPNYLILERLGWLDGYAALVVPFLASPFVIYLLRQFFLSLPDELWDAARIDGASRMRYFWSVVLPLSRPALVSAGILTFLGHWNSLLWPMIATTRPEMRTLMTGLQGFNEEIAAEPNLLMAAAGFSMLPILAAFFALQRAFLQTAARSGIKG